jgi:hypothetical protein
MARAGARRGATAYQPSVDLAFVPGAAQAAVVAGPVSSWKVNRINGPKRAPRRYATTCKICNMSVFDGDETVWLTSPMGISHKTCAP